ncbi:MAG: M23 family metallopeptidase [Bdellovibrionia bacterium]
MTDKGQLAQFKKDQRGGPKLSRSSWAPNFMLLALKPLGVCLLVVHLAGCATSTTADVPVASNQVVQSGAQLESPMKLPLDIRAELSSGEVPAGTLVLITLHLPEGVQAPAVNQGNQEDSSNQAVFSGEFEGTSFSFFTAPDLGPQVYEAVLGIPYERKPGKAVIQVRGEQNLEIPFKVIDGHYPSETLHVDGRRVNPTKKKDLIRIKKEFMEVAAIYKRVTPKKYWSGRFSYPIQSSVTSVFGGKRVYNGSLKNYHPGLDLKAPMRTPVYSPAPGIVVLAKNLFYTGNTVMIDHGYGVITLYAHMTELKVKKDDIVGKERLLGLSGKTGRVTGPHLHWQAVVNHVKVNPIGLTEVMR